MVINYSDFLIEKQILAINESDVIFSDKFRKLLKGISSPVSSGLLEIENKDFDVTSNFFDISDTKDSISFIPDRKAKDIISNEKQYVIYDHGNALLNSSEKNGYLFKALGYEPDGEKAYSPEEGERGLVVSKTVAPSGKTYLYVQFEDGKCVMNKDYFKEDTNSEVWTKNRQSVRVGRGVKALLNSAKKKFTDAEIEEFVNKYKSAYDRMNDIFRDFELVEGDKISYWYNRNNYHKREQGTLGNSCMAGVPSSYLEIYTNNPNVCKLLILKTDDDKIKGRALIWVLPEDYKYLPGKQYFMDRIYTNDDSDVELFREYSKHKGWYYKSNNNSSNDCSTIAPSGDRKDLIDLHVIVKSGSYSKYPYLDTLKYYDRDNGKLGIDSDSSTICLEDTGGGYVGDCEMCDGSMRVECPDCDGSGEIRCEECSNGKIDCGECNGEGEIECLECQGSGKDDEGNDCEECSGNGKNECYECNGHGTKECPDCNGTSYSQCSNCYGDGQVDCPEC